MVAAKAGETRPATALDAAKAAVPETKSRLFKRSSLVRAPREGEWGHRTATRYGNCGHFASATATRQTVPRQPPSRYPQASSDHAGAPDLRDLRRRVTGLAQDLVGMLAERGRWPFDRAAAMLQPETGANHPDRSVLGLDVLQHGAVLEKVELGGLGNGEHAASRHIGLGEALGPGCRGLLLHRALDDFVQGLVVLDTGRPVDEARIGQRLLATQD